MPPRLFTLSTLIVASTLLRVALILYSEWHDAHSVLKYTDVDYFVFSDAVRFLLHPSPHNRAQGPLGAWLGFGDPYTRETYRYTPLLAVLLAPNEWVHPAFGKYLFAACDILAGLLIHRILVHTLLPVLYSQHPTPTPALTARIRTTALLCTAAHLLNPLVFTISTRGSSESVLILLVLSTLALALAGRFAACAVLLGVSTHWKIYPVVYGVACVALIAREQVDGDVDGDVGRAKRRGGRSWRGALFSGPVVRFVVMSAGTFALCNAAMYAIWGYPFLYESLLYHLNRRDHRHNFSPYFYLTYLTYPSSLPHPHPLPPATPLSPILRSPLISFLPQMSLALSTGALGVLGRAHLPFTWFLQTAAFVLLNKVCTSQYFLWYLSLLPLLLPALACAPAARLSRGRAGVLGLVWAGTQGVWLAEAYRLEFGGEEVFWGVWVRGVGYVLGNAWVLGEVVKAYAAAFAGEGEGGRRRAAAGAGS